MRDFQAVECSIPLEITSARRPHQPAHATDDTERPARCRKPTMRTLNGGVCYSCQDRPPRRGLSSGRPILLLLQAAIRVRAGPIAKHAAPSGAGHQACGTERVISPAPLHGALRGVPAEGVAGDSKAATAQGKAFPSELDSVYLWTIHRPKNRPKTDFRPVRRNSISKSTRYLGI